jgi:hydroxymethylglutaryl-CoA lyase
MNIPTHTKIIEVGPRDGLQGWPTFVSTNDKVEIINRLSDTGLPVIEVTSFVHPKMVPNLSDAEEVMARIDRHNGTIYQVLVPNRKGAERALAVNVDRMNGLITCSEEYNEKNQNMTIKENLLAINEIAKVTRNTGIPLGIGLGCCFFCPYQGAISQEHVLKIIDKLVAYDVSSITVASTTGMAHPVEVYELLCQIRENWPNLEISLHLHNVNGLAMANILAALEAGVTTFEASINGLGGGIIMPKGMEVGNVPTEDVVYMFHQMGINTGIDFSKLQDVAEYTKGVLRMKHSNSYVMNGATREKILMHNTNHDA